MKPKIFPEVTVMVAEHQDQYQTLPVTGLSDGSLVSCWELDEEEKRVVAETGEIWFKQVTQFELMQPILPSVHKTDFITEQISADVMEWKKQKAAEGDKSPEKVHEARSEDNSVADRRIEPFHPDEEERKDNESIAEGAKALFGSFTKAGLSHEHAKAATIIYLESQYALYCQLERMPIDLTSIVIMKTVTGKILDEINKY